MMDQGNDLTKRSLSSTETCKQYWGTTSFATDPCQFGQIPERNIMGIGQMKQKELLLIEFLPTGIVIVEVVRFFKMLFTLGKVRWAVVECLSAADANIAENPIGIVIQTFNRDAIRDDFVNCLKEEARSSGPGNTRAGPAFRGNMPPVRMFHGCFQVTEAYVTQPAPALTLRISNSAEMRSLCVSKSGFPKEKTKGGGMCPPINKI